MNTKTRQELFSSLLKKKRISAKLINEIKCIYGIDILSIQKISVGECESIYKYIYDNYNDKSAKDYVNSISILLSKICDYKFNIRCNGIKSFYLTYQDITKIDLCENLNDLENIVRKMFVICCLTGCDLEYVNQFKKENIINGNFFYTTKNGINVSVPIHSLLNKYLYDDVEIKKLNGSTRMSILRDILKKSGLNVSIAIESENGEINIYYKHNITTFSTAQISFATNLYHEGYSIEEIQSYMGLKIRRNAISKIVGYIPSKKKEFF